MNEYDCKSCFVISKIDLPKDRTQVNFMDPFERQVFHQFEKLSLEEGGGFEYYRLEKEAPQAMAIICTQSDLKFYHENEAQILEHKRKSLIREQKHVCLSEEEGEEFNHVEPKPWDHHKFCGICKEAYEDYYNHIDSKQHKDSLKLQQYFLKQIDGEINELVAKEDLRTIS